MPPVLRLAFETTLSATVNEALFLQLRTVPLSHRPTMPPKPVSAEASRFSTATAARFSQFSITPYDTPAITPNQLSEVTLPEKVIEQSSSTMMS